MAAAVAPTIDDKFLPSTPPHEWANDTLHAQSSAMGGMTAGSTTSTPGLEPPGAYPRVPEERVLNGNHKQEGSGVLDKAKQYIPAQEDVGKALKNVGETAKQYLPQSLASYFPGAGQPPTSLPSQENGVTPSDGVGSLPGNASESAVALLPEERSQTTSLPSQDNNLTSNTGVGDLPGSSSESAVALLPEERARNNENEGSTSNAGVGNLPGSSSESAVALLPEERARDNENEGLLPKGSNVDTSVLTPATSLDTANRSESISNVSTLAQDGSEHGKSTPGFTPALTPTPSSATAASETSIVPDSSSQSVERSDPAPETQSPLASNGPRLNLTPRTHPLAAKGATWKGVPLDEEYQTHLDSDPEKQLNIGTTTPTISTSSPISNHAPVTSNIAGATTTSSTVVEHGHERASQSSQTTVPDRDVNGTASRFSEHDPTNESSLAPVASGGSLGSKGSGSTAGTDGGQSGGRRSKLLNKIKGEVKVISGKLGGKEEMVEEGKRLMGKV